MRHSPKAEVELHSAAESSSQQSDVHAASRSPTASPSQTALRARTAAFWTHAAYIYSSYKARQLQAAILKNVAGWSAQKLEDELWKPHHAWAGRELHALAVSTRGFYLKLAQLVSARSEFVPAPVCAALSTLHDRVPPARAAAVRATIEGELGGIPLGSVFEWIDLDTPLGSASVAQVHKAKLRGVSSNIQHSGHLHTSGRLLKAASQPVRWMWRKLGPKPAAAAMDGPPAGATILPVPQGLPPFKLDTAATAIAKECGGIVAVKVQHPGAAEMMAADLQHCRSWASFLAATEIGLDLVSAVSELEGQVALEFDFVREATVMDSVGSSLNRAGISRKVSVPQSVPGLVTARLLTMTYLSGVPLSRLKEHSVSPAIRARATRSILSSLCEVYGHTILIDGLFQADAHPGNVLVKVPGINKSRQTDAPFAAASLQHVLHLPKADRLLSAPQVSLIDFGLSKQLPTDVRLAFARLVTAMAPGAAAADAQVVSKALSDLGVCLGSEEPALHAAVAFCLLDTRLTNAVNPFDPESPIKRSPIRECPQDVILILRVIQMLRGLASAGGVNDFSVVESWAPKALAATSAGRADGMAVSPLTDAWNPVCAS